MDRVYFKSIYTNDPDGHIVELATAGPGFAVDETVASGHEPATAAVAGTTSSADQRQFDADSAAGQRRLSRPT